MGFIVGICIYLKDISIPGKAIVMARTLGCPGVRARGNPLGHRVLPAVPVAQPLTLYQKVDTRT